MKKVLSCALWVLLCWLPYRVQAQVKPDLVIVAPFNIPSNVLSGGIYQMSAVIKNQGTNGSQFNCIGYYLSADNVWDATDAYMGASCQALLFPGQSGTCSVMGTIPPLTATGNYYLLLVADPLNAELELDETNNVVSFSLAVTKGNSALPDLELWRPSISFDAVPAGGSTGAFTFIFNRGPGAVGGYELGFYLSADTVFSAGNDVFLGLVTGGGLVLNNGTIHSAPVLTVPGSTVPGNYYLLLVADPRNAVAESNENNNSRALALRVTGAITAVTPSAATEMSVYPNPVALGGRLGVYLNGAENGKPLQLAFYDALGREVSLSKSIATGRQVAFDTPDLPAGVYWLRVVGDNATATRRLVIE
ncbi:CARDB domain-containing protein [Hymenobacter sp. BT770]|uniref:T9SS type A sorting domain-containing protein n=1 Tax=Hymenobacter sp. BT770 TaxID=2886942 RepID=UPI001D110682|nr:CARDB domain-containing protein [Hymenobacter sp. BT770]MCC3154299.1 T9SS type A sorting domain-containing protein [Hymenobacter sp. BT770]MDO3415620.1 CARDB domain-containing protein [Hymenobacter sp. BT770]